MKPMKSVRGIILDMDGVLCDSEPFICEAASRMFADRHRLKVKPEDFIAFVGSGEDRYLGGVAEKYGLKLDLRSDKDYTYAVYLEIIKGRLKPLPGAKQFVADCRRRGFKLALATSADRVKMTGNLDEINLPVENFDAAISGSEIQHKKPHPEIFLLAAKKLCLAPLQCLVVEDSPNGIKAAKAAGMPALGLTTGFEEKILTDAGADIIAPDLSRLPAGMFES